MADGMMLGWKRECADADELLRLMFPDQQPNDFRTDGGWINLSKVRDLWSHRNAGVNAHAAPEPFTVETVREMCARAAEAERHACAIVVWMTKMDAVDSDADDKGVSGWLEEAEARVKARGRSLRECLAAAGVAIPFTTNQPKEN